jgi:hypothetical protein
MRKTSLLKDFLVDIYSGSGKGEHQMKKFMKN